MALVMQDIDAITESTESTSILTDSAMIGQKGGIMANSHICLPLTASDRLARAVR